MGGINGFISFNSRQFTENKYYPPVVLTEFYLFNKKADINAKDSPLKTSISFTERLDLKYNQNSFAFKFAALGYSTSGTNYSTNSKDSIKSGTLPTLIIR